LSALLENDYAAGGLDAEAALKFMERFTSRLKYYLAPESPALRDTENSGRSHYCMPAAASVVTGEVREKDGRRWITATHIAPTRLKFPDRMLQADLPFVMPKREPLLLQVDGKLTLKCVPIPAGRFLMGTPFYMWPYHAEEYPHLATLTHDYFLSEIPVTQAIYQAVMGENPSPVKDPNLPVANPKFAAIERFCEILSQKNGTTVRLPTSAEWEYAARVGTSSPGFSEKYQDQNSSGSSGYKSPLPVRSKKANAWGLYDMASCWWEITGDKAMYHIRTSVVDPHFPPGAESARSQRTGRGIVTDKWSITTHEFITEAPDYASQKFRVVVELEAPRPQK